MVERSLEEKRIKELLKEGVLEALHEQRELLYDVIAEVMEDLALGKAIQEGEATKSVAKEEVFKNLPGAP